MTVPVMIPLLILRPEPGASATALRAQAIGLDVIKCPLFEIAPRPWAPVDPQDFDAVLFTSANAIRHGGDALLRLKALPVLAVGDATAESARALGFSDVTAGQANGPALVQMAAEKGYRTLLHLCGHDHRSLSHADVSITAVTVYEAHDAESSAEMLHAVKMSCIVLAHSPRAARRLAEIVTDRSLIDVITISAAASDAAGTGWRSVQSAARPDDTLMLALAHRLCFSEPAHL
jgi:uroporphyrinogen-III synthase